ncbi:MAG: hypothetical protein CMK50_07075 [Propionibacteriaceae bacterium]|nr:hypothetical protein [Propionibacteriaceae bacterium]
MRWRWSRTRQSQRQVSDWLIASFAAFALVVDASCWHPPVGWFRTRLQLMSPFPEKESKGSF